MIRRLRTRQRLVRRCRRPIPVTVRSDSGSGPARQVSLVRNLWRKSPLPPLYLLLLGVPLSPHLRPLPEWSHNDKISIASITTNNTALYLQAKRTKRSRCICRERTRDFATRTSGSTASILRERHPSRGATLTDYG